MSIPRISTSRKRVRFSDVPPTIHEMNPAMFIRGEKEEIPEILEGTAYDRRKLYVTYRLNKQIILKKIEEERWDDFIRIKVASQLKAQAKRRRIRDYRKKQIENYYIDKYQLSSDSDS